ncbi:DNA polymerase III subunit delta' [Ursidibacter maritimus]|uniref:DNA polymerase III subunit delta' n=1 Tax=Ursidibacter maritimus TaxID=1331689 RepID=A0A949T1C4_9PAST|nr:DNA polymerase III subunit delta' [Ursidibacter maritimus]KAE9541492.1 DNA polymerase III subunit delta' [Ursidibacter maritimus]MBV6524626.1 DNA polymerase III subunit delta' [Ursidibacter maritimus]MBV6526039.1 DNA polymerase III subunit delta' [Ursidibacter maritimus]MBV6528340.1 DNA polymerase III subunit delta' [Ursidibacter maritimus]MBV6529620.1 DNA polymerase III subunit delta' [Ursidibacter maritimus]
MNLYPWHSQIYQQLTHSFLNGRGHHALLFKTEVGLGTELLIRQFAHWLFCQEKQLTEPCGRCKTCVLWQSGNHPDYHLIESIDGKDIGVDQIRELTTKLQQFSQQGGNSVIYIAGANRLTEAASNALLKTLEEPNEKIYFLLEAPLQSAMLATIQSRCQTWLVHTPYVEQAYQWLQPQFPEYQVAELQTALRICHNRPLICKKFLESDRLQERKTFLQTFWKFYKSGDVWLLFQAFSSEIERQCEQLEWLDSFFTDALKAKLNIAAGWVNPDLQAGIIPFSQALSAQKLLKGHYIIQQTQRDLLEVNAVNSELMLVNCLTKLAVEVFN